MNKYSDENVRQQVVDIIAKEINIPGKANEIADSDLLQEDLELDSLDIVTVIMSIENDFDIDAMPDEKVDKLRTVGDLVESTKSLLK